MEIPTRFERVALATPEAASLIDAIEAKFAAFVGADLARALAGAFSAKIAAAPPIIETPLMREKMALVTERVKMASPEEFVTEGFFERTLAEVVPEIAPVAEFRDLPTEIMSLPLTILVPFGRSKFPLLPRKLGIPNIRIISGATTYDWEETELAVLAPPLPINKIEGSVFRVHKPTIVEVNFFSPSGTAEVLIRYGFFIFPWWNLLRSPFRGQYTYSFKVEPLHMMLPYEFSCRLVGSAPTITLRKVS
jgi:hypothetical protein